MLKQAYMILINRTETDPYFNIAAEEYVLKNFLEDVFMLWVNGPSVIVGKHQVAAAEADILFTWKENIPVIRRISGGGTVYHDEGNLNYSLVLKGERGRLVDYQKYAGTVIRALEKVSIPAVLQGKSSLFTGGKKFSGNAEHVYHDRVLHHGTLLFNTDMALLRRCIRPAHSGYADKSIRSVDNNTTNLIGHFPPGYSLESFRTLLIEQAWEDYGNIKAYSFSKEDHHAIQELVKNKYSGMEWNFAYSPKYEVKGKIEHENVEIQIRVSVVKGRIIELDITENGKQFMGEISKKLVNCMHHPENVSEELNKINFAPYNIPGEKILEGMF